MTPEQRELLNRDWWEDELKAAIRAALEEVDALRLDRERLDKIIVACERTHRELFGNEPIGWLFDEDGEVMSGCVDTGYRYRTLREAIDAIEVQL